MIIRVIARELPPDPARPTMEGRQVTVETNDQRDTVWLRLAARSVSDELDEINRATLRTRAIILARDLHDVSWERAEGWVNDVVEAMKR